MGLYGDNFLKIRNQHVLPLVSYGIARKKYQYWSFKDIITKNVISLNKLQGKSVEVEISKSDYYRALHCEIELFMNKATIQYADYIKSQTSSPSWSFVTLYYLTFFSTTCFFRFLNRGFIFFSSEQIKRLEDFSQAVYSDVISLDSGNYYFNLKETTETDTVIITLTFKGDNIHKQNWIQLEATFREMLADCDETEETIIKTFISHFAAFKTEYPSWLRNRLNYNSDSSILDLEASVMHVDLSSFRSDFLKGLVGVDLTPDMNSQIASIGFLSSYLLGFITELYKEYLQRSEHGKDFSLERKIYLENNNIKQDY
ncbi:hypothetical protein LZD49_32930 [Dyadobacter sp. CY261]|uniref:hypothetical protein n=1 Tax=Dyadobacter sp. CY261 TaxID=2907203 RepID=UPI001F1E1CBF|nr:hypothetical protein [Dyadobacter sp. CY261]MCF0075329.1 hypothetical protein [Dyadobacter sp. CY261]